MPLPPAQLIGRGTTSGGYLLKLSEAFGLLSLKAPRFPDILHRCKTIEDVRKAARRRVPQPVFDYVDGGADDEVSLRGNERAFGGYRFRPVVLNDVSEPDLTSDILGTSAAMPIGLAPTGYTKMVHPQGEAAVGRAAARAGTPYVLSTMSSTSIEDLRRVLPGSDLWFQLYVWKDRGVTRELVSRAWESGYRVIEVSVDTAVSGYRVRDVRNGLTIPPQVNWGSAMQIAVKPRYWTTMLRHPKMTFANFDPNRSIEQDRTSDGFTIENITTQFDPSLTWDQLSEIRDLWPGSLAIKGPIGPEDARRALHYGVDAVHLSNHGGRQLDRTIAPVDLIKPVREATADNALEIFVDSGVRHGADVATALALGAQAAFIGRPYLYGLAVAQERGVDHVLQLLRQQLTRTMQLLGVRNVSELRERGSELLMSSKGIA